jgi:hypothetical protein
MARGIPRLLVTSAETAQRGFRIHPRGFLDVLEEKKREHLAVFDDLELLGAQVLDRPARSVRHPDVEPHEVGARAKDGLRSLRGRRDAHGEEPGDDDAHVREF